MHVSNLVLESDPGKIVDRNCPIGALRSQPISDRLERSTPIGQFRSSIFPGSDARIERVLPV